MRSTTHGAIRNGHHLTRAPGGGFHKKGKTMESYLEQYEARDGGVTLHTWTDVQGIKKENFYITEMPGTPIPWWFRKVLRQKYLADIVDFPYSPSRF
jgi:hypothetical protein